MSVGKVLLGALAGLAAGAVLGILFAPEKGSKTRKKLYRKRDELTDGIEDNFNEFIENVTQKFESLKEEAVRRSENGKPKAETMAAKK